MRIIGGKYRGKKLPVSNKLDLRPTTDFAKESLFNLLMNRKDIHDIHFLDIFSGTGNISYELISRGASSGRCVDISLASHKYREKLIAILDMKGELRSIKSEGLKFLRRTTDSYDIIFADPPYNYEHIHEIPRIVFQRELLKANGLLILEHSED
ncbi:MAG: 16S rRNA (guanine(966)-N(2))-methyltransferase RsmD, partial [Flavobacteriales bacterium]|nr:16S rRNA (guanine(966)-N(2))-methyltransferase RsmD [Flavobacteriales bacterium]